MDVPVESSLGGFAGSKDASIVLRHLFSSTLTAISDSIKPKLVVDYFLTILLRSFLKVSPVVLNYGSMSSLVC